MVKCLGLLACLALLAGCIGSAETGTPNAPRAEPPLLFSLFSSESATLDEATIARLLGSRVEIPADARVAVLQAPSTALARSFSYYGLTEDELRAKEADLDTLRAQLVPSGVREVEALSSAPGAAGAQRAGLARGGGAAAG